MSRALSAGNVLSLEQMEWIEYHWPKIPPHHVDGIAQGYKVDCEIEGRVLSPSHLRDELSDLAKRLKSTIEKVESLKKTESGASALSWAEWRLQVENSTEAFLKAAREMEEITISAIGHVPERGDNRNRPRNQLILTLQRALKDAGYMHMRGKLVPLLQIILEACDGEQFDRNQVDAMIRRANSIS